MIRFRDAAEADLAGVVALLADDELGGKREDPGPPLPGAYTAGFRKMTAQGGRILLIVDGDLIVGCLQMHVLYGVSTRSMARAQIEGVRVAGARRGERLGTQLMQHAVAEARAAGCGLVQLTTDLSRIDAQRFYRGLGFVQSHAGMKLML